MLLIDDDPATGRACGRILSRIGIEVHVATSGKEAIARAKHGGFDLLLVDLRLPDIPGLETVEALHRERIRIPFLITSGFATASDVVRAMKLGAVDVLEKSIDRAALIAAVQSALAVHAPCAEVSSPHQWTDGAHIVPDSPRLLVI